MKTLLSKTIDWLQMIIVAVAPEYLDRVPYILIGRNGYPVAGSHVPELRHGRQVYGCTSRSLASLSRPALEKDGRWRGLLPAIWLNGRAIIRDRPKAQYPPQTRALLVRANLIGVTLHELGHIADDGDRCVDVSSFGATKWANQVKAFDRFVSTDDPEDATPTKYLHHGESLIRLCIHLACRARMCGLPIPASVVIHTANYELAHDAEQYAAALGSEPQQMIRATLQEVRKSPAPLAFSSLFQKDVAARNGRLQAVNS